MNGKIFFVAHENYRITQNQTSSFVSEICRGVRRHENTMRDYREYNKREAALISTFFSL
jgi:hypothetical protein